VGFREEEDLPARGLGAGLIQLHLAGPFPDDEGVVGPQRLSHPLGQA
jgi:hypothetical protein